MEEEVTRTLFEELIAELVERTHDPIDVVLRDAGISEQELDMILLVGGSTRVPAVRRDIAEYLGREPVWAIDPDYAVAEGAAIQAGILSGELDGEQSLVMMDVNPYTLGVRAVNGFRDDYMSVVIPRNTTIPVTKKEIYSTAGHGQTTAEIEVYQGEFSSVEQNHRLGCFQVEGIPANEAGAEKIEVAFSYNIDGMLNVSAVVVSTGKAVEITIDMLERGREERMDVSGWKDALLAGSFRTVIRRSEKWLKANRREADEETVREVEEYLYLLKKAILEDNEDKAEEYEDELRYEMED